MPVAIGCGFAEPEQPSCIRSVAYGRLLELFGSRRCGPRGSCCGSTPCRICPAEAAIGIARMAVVDSGAAMPASDVQPDCRSPRWRLPKGRYPGSPQLLADEFERTTPEDVHALRFGQGDDAACHELGEVAAHRFR